MVIRLSFKACTINLENLIFNCLHDYLYGGWAPAIRGALSLEKLQSGICIFVLLFD